MKHQVNSEYKKVLKDSLKYDLLSGFLVFLISLPLSLGVAMASGFPPIAGIMTAIIGGILGTFLTGSQTTIKGPAAGLIVIALGAVQELGKGDLMLGYKLTLAVIVVAGVIQVLLGILKTGVIGDFFPSSAVHGMLAAIGVIIIGKQVHTLVGISPEGKEPIELLMEIPHSITHLNPEIALIGLLSLCILFVIPLIKNKYLKNLPAPMLVILIGIPLGYYFDLEHIHKYLFLNSYEYEVGPSFLVTLPENILSGITFPDFSQIFTIDSGKYIIMFALVGSVESLLSTKATDILDPLKRKSNLNKDLFGVGVLNTLCGFIGAMPMISEIVRSSANINSGAKTKWSNFFHGIFLLGFVALLPNLIHQIPLTVLAAMLIFTGYKLASPQVFFETFKVGKDQLAIFIVTFMVTLFTDLIIGIVSGIAIKLLLHLSGGVRLKSLFKSRVLIINITDNLYLIEVKGSAIFSNYLGIKRKLDKIPKGHKIILDFENARMIDHTVIEHLHHYGEDYKMNGGDIVIKGLENHRQYSSHPLSTRVHNGMEKKSREKQLQLVGESLGFNFKLTDDSISNFGKLANEVTKIKYEGNILTNTIEDTTYRVSDISIVKGGSMKPEVMQSTVLSIKNPHLLLPVFSLEKEDFISKTIGKIFINDINFKKHTVFSETYILKGISYSLLQNFFTEELLNFFEKENMDYHLECMGTEILIYKTGRIATFNEIQELIRFGFRLMNIIAEHNNIAKYVK